MRTNEIREKNDNELTQELKSLKQELFKIRFQHATKQLENPMQLKRVKKDIARVQTIIRERELQSIEK